MYRIAIQKHYHIGMEFIYKNPDQIYPQQAVTVSLSMGMLSISQVNRLIFIQSGTLHMVPIRVLF